MRKLTYSTALILLLFAGCMQESNITGPADNVHKTQAKTIIMLPAKADMNVEDVFSSSQYINGVNGGEIHLVKSYVAENGRTVNIDCKLTVPANNVSFADSRNITMQVSDQAGVDFSPSMTFNQPVILNFVISGLDLSDVNPADVEFDYVDQYGDLSPTANDGISVDQANGVLQVVNARLPHFSRWAYAR